MNNNTQNITYIPEEVLELIPWFAIGKLSVDAQAFFENALLSYPSLQKQVKLEKHVIGLVSADNSLLDKSVIAPTEERLKSVFNIIDSSELPSKVKSHNQSNVTSSLLEKLKNAFDSLIPNPQHARFASVSVLVLSVAVLASFIAPKQSDTSVFIPASAVTQPTDNQASLVNAKNTILLVGFKGTSAELSDNDALKGKQIKIESPPDKDGFFQISFKGLMSKDEIKQTLDALLAQKEIIWFAGEAF